MKNIQKTVLIVFISSFLIALFFLIATYLNLGELIDPDSWTYFYILDPKSGINFFPSQRPFVFPIYLWFTKSIGEYISIPIYLYANYVVFSLSIAIITSIVWQKTKNFFALILTFLFAIVNIQITQFSNYLNPEILLTFFISLHVYVLNIFYKDSGTKNILLLLLTYFLMTFTKPIFLYYPFISFPFLLLTSRKKITNKRNRYLKYFVLIYLVPVFLWSFINFKKYDEFTFSLISQNNIAGKIMQYDLVNKGPDDDKYKSLKNALTNEDPIYSEIYSRLPLIEEASGNESVFKYLGDFNKKTVQINFYEYTFKSIKEIPLILKAIPLRHEDRYFIRIDFSVNSFMYFLFEMYAFLWSFIQRLYVYIILLMITAAVISSKKKDYWYFHIFMTWFYVIIIMSFGAYSGLSRLRAVVDNLFVLLMIFSFYTNMAYLLSCGRLFYKKIILLTNHLSR